MNLTDREILELNELCGALVDARASDEQRRRLEELLRHSEEARRFYIRALGQSASLQHYAGEMHADAPVGRKSRGGIGHFPGWAKAALLAAAVVAVGGFVVSLATRRSGDAATERAAEHVARLTGAKDAKWGRSAVPLLPGAHLRRGQRVELESGYAEITFDSGARVVLEGTATLEIVSAWDATLRRGVLKADVPAQAIGFRVANRFVDVVDLGTEFTMIADAERGAEVLVNKGEVEAAPRVAGESESIVLREKEARRFASTGVSDVPDRVRKLALFDAPVRFDRYAATTSFGHWSFDEPQGVAQGEGPLSTDAGVELVGEGDRLGATRVEGRWHRALDFNGQRYARVGVPGLADRQPRTVAFWVRIPVDAQPTDTWMVAWGTQLPKLGRRPVHIGWNRRPAEGALGALRTDFGGGHAIGTTNLRDGNWHHVAVFFAPGEEADTPVQVKQYVDGRLESSTVVRGTLSPRAGTGDATIAHTIWLGYRLTGNRQEGRRFHGQIDELFIADRALQPVEIVALMQDNRLPPGPVAANP